MPTPFFICQSEVHMNDLQKYALEQFGYTEKGTNKIVEQYKKSKSKGNIKISLETAQTALKSLKTCISLESNEEQKKQFKRAYKQIKEQTSGSADPPKGKDKPSRLKENYSSRCKTLSV